MSVTEVYKRSTEFARSHCAKEVVLERRCDYISHFKRNSPTFYSIFCVEEYQMNGENNFPHVINSVVIIFCIHVGADHSGHEV
jgi:hypothetical protein